MLNTSALLCIRVLQKVLSQRRVFPYKRSESFVAILTSDHGNCGYVDFDFPFGRQNQASILEVS